jgi:uncharacterized membrane protein
MNFYEFIKKAFIEIVKTFSNKTSFLSSKRIERFFVFITMLSISIYYLVKSIYYSEISSVDFMIVVGGWLGYNGFSIIQGKKEKTIDTNNENN